MNWKKELERNLLDNIIPFWDRLIDHEYGGVYGECSNHGVIKKDALKGAVYLSRLLWSYAKLYKRYQDEKFYNHATWIFDFIEKNMYDKENGGIVWAVEFDGKVHDNQKHLYAQCFYLYAISEYYSVSNNPICLQRIEEVVNIIEKNLIDFPNNYHEAYTYDFKPIENKIMYGYDMLPEITTNTLLHLAEGISSCYVYTKNKKYQAIVLKLLDIIFEYGYDKENSNLYQFLNYKLENQTDVISYGHNIEVSWLFKKIIDDTNLDCPKYLVLLKELAIKTINEGFNGNYLHNEKLNGILDTSAIWWVQAECLIGLKYYFEEEKMISLFKYIQNNLITEEEWFWGRTPSEEVMTNHNQAEMWKANYHNIRAILEITGDDYGK